MKKFRITCTIADGERENTVEILFPGKRLNQQEAVRIISGVFITDSDRSEQFAKVLEREGHATFPNESRVIRNFTWEEIEPVTVIVRKGMVEDIKNIPGNVEIKVVDWDTDELDENDNPIPSVDYWGSRESTPAPQGG